MRYHRAMRPVCVEHECSGSGENMTPRVVVGPFENVDFLTKL
jgi:hypothetical protein